MTKLGECCCGCGCDKANQTAFQTLTFDSPGGLHPVSFSNDLWVSSNGTLPVPLAIRANAYNANLPPTCTDPYLGQWGLNRWTEPRRLTKDLQKRTTCCWSALSVPSVSGGCRSSSRFFSQTSGDSFEYSIQRYRTYFPGGACGSGTADLGTTIFNYDRVSKQSIAVRRYVEGVELQACFVTDGYYGLRLKLTAIVSYRDWIDVRNESHYRSRERFSGHPSYTQYATPSPGCMTVAAAPAYDVYPCPSSLSVAPDAPDVIRPTACESCTQAGALTTPDGVSVYPGTCESETITRSIYLDPFCTIAGTHVFPSGLSPTPKIVGGFNPCVLSSIDPCQWRFLIPGCNPSTTIHNRAFPVSGTDVRNTTGFDSLFDQGFESETTVTTVGTPSSPYAIGDASGTILMNWWTEDWIITIA